MKLLPPLILFFILLFILPSVPIASAEKTIEFSGYKWYVKESDAPVGPGPNYFSGENVFVDEEGLHLKITFDLLKLKLGWCCAEVFCTEKLGYGTYIFHTNSMIDELDKNVVLGLFVYENDEEEIDIEFSRWGVENNTNAQYVVQPWNHSGNVHRFDIELTGDKESCHMFTWKRDCILFESSFLNSTEIWNYTGKDIPLCDNERPHINLWLYQGMMPSDLKEVEVVITKFEFVPLRNQSQNSAGGAVDGTTATKGFIPGFGAIIAVLSIMACISGRKRREQKSHLHQSSL